MNDTDLLKIDLSGVSKQDFLSEVLIAEDVGKIMRSIYDSKFNKSSNRSINSRACSCETKKVPVL